MKHIPSFPFALLSLILLLNMGLASCKEKPGNVLPNNNELQVDVQYRPFIHHFSSTGCGPCGRFGVPVLQKVADDMGDSIFAFITHFKYQDPFITPSSKAIEQAILDEWYSPQIWIENNNITFDILGKDVSTAAEIVKQQLRTALTQPAEAYLGLRKNFKQNHRTDIEWVIKNATDSSATFFVEIYGMEDSLIASQAGAPNNLAAHYRVNRGGFYGQMGKEITLDAGAEYRDSFEYIPCWTCKPSTVYFNAIIWKKNSNNKYEYVNGLEIR